MDGGENIPLPFLTRKMLAFEGAASFDLELSTASSAIIAVELTGMTREGPFKFNFITNGLSLMQVNTFAIPDIPIAVTVRTKDNNNSANDVYAMLYLRINNTKNTLLCQGMIGQVYGINWPNQSPLAQLQTRGQMISIHITNPGAGVNWQEPIPNGENWKIKGVYARLVTSAVVASRRVSFQITQGDSVGGAIMLPTISAQESGQTVVYSLFEGAALVDDTVSGIKTAPLPADLVIRPAGMIESKTINIQGGDQWNLVLFIIEKFYSAQV